MPKAYQRAPGYGPVSMRYSIASIAVPALVAAALAACGGEPPRPTEPGPAPGASVATRPWLVDATRESGLDFRHENGATGELFFVEMMGAGAALFDCDNDGDLDLLLRQGGPLVRSGAPPASAPTDRLLRNDLEAASAGLLVRPRFVDVTAGSGLDRASYGMGVATGDYDGDGIVDLYLTNFGPNRLLRGLGDCRFEDRTEAAGAGDDRWSVPATFFDADGDGDLDLFVGNYLRYSLAEDQPCFRADSTPDYCGPKTFPAEADRYLENRGDGTFADRTIAAGFAAAEPGRALGAIAFDLDADGSPELFVANDSTDNHLFVSRADGTFEDRALERGVAVNAAGLRTGDMGVEAADFDGDGDSDLAVTHFPEEGLGYWDNDGAGSFWERGAAAGLVRATLGDTGFGVAALDLDHDGWLDLYFANGAVQAIERLSAPGSNVPLAQPNRLLRNLGGSRFEDVSAAAGEALAPSEVSRGVAAGDVDNDGDTDVVVTNNGGPARLLLSGASTLGPWLGLRLLTADGRRDALGAEVTLTCASGRRLIRRVHTDGSYASAGDPRLLFGLADCAPLPDLEVRWPWGSRERFPSPPPGAYHVLRPGDGAPAD